MLYLGAGAPHAPASGMDVVCRAHLDELLAAHALHVSGVVVAPASAGAGARAAALGAFGGVSVIAGDAPARLSRSRRAWDKARYALTGSGAMMAYAFRSVQARAFIRKALAASTHDVVVVDHFNALANIALGDLRACPAAVVYIAHDAVPAQIRDTGRFKPRWKAGLFALEAAKAAIVERALLRLARVTAFLSEADRQRHRRMAARTVTLLPNLPVPDPRAPGRAADGTLLFMGSTGFPPNAFAVRWLVERFAPALHRAAPSLHIVLVGGGTDRVAAATGNLAGRGFVPEDELRHLIDACLGVICPVIHGSGIKIKLLDAIARGCAVFATAPALRGLERFQIEPALDIADPAGSVVRVLALAGDPARLSGERARLAGAWREHARARHGRLAALIREAACLPSQDGWDQERTSRPGCIAWASPIKMWIRMR